MKTTSILPAACVLAATLLSADSCFATQHLVRAGSNWMQLDERLKPGDEIILMPGRHRPVTLESAQGASGQPIIIRGLDPEDPPTIEADRYGIRLRNPRHVRIMDIRITGATINGIALERVGEVNAEGETLPAEPAGPVLVNDVSITDTGPRGARHALLVQGLDRVSIVDCEFEGWAGSAIEIVACTDVTVDGCRFAGKEDFTQVSGVRVRAGSDRVNIERCRFTDPGDQGVCIGGVSEMTEFASPPADDAEPNTLFEASRVNVLNCVFSGGRCALALAGCKGATVRNCTVVRPRQSILSIRREQVDPRFGSATACTFGMNIITWQPGDLKSLTHLGPNVHTEGLTLEENLWWTPNWEEVREQLGPFPGTSLWGQVTDLDPKLDDDLKPGEDAARAFGANVH